MFVTDDGTGDCRTPSGVWRNLAGVCGDWCVVAGGLCVACTPYRISADRSELVEDHDLAGRCWWRFSVPSGDWRDSFSAAADVAARVWFHGFPLRFADLRVGCGRYVHEDDRGEIPQALWFPPRDDHQRHLRRDFAGGYRFVH